MKISRNSICGAFAAAALALLAPAANAQDWPKNKPIQFVVGFAPGSTIDIVARFIAPKLSEAKAIAEADPMHSSGARKFRIRPWCLNEGSYTVTVRYSEQYREVI